jgi:probable HAF family extracellular repeat protein
MALRLSAVAFAVAVVAGGVAAAVLAEPRVVTVWSGRDLGTLGGRHSSAWAINDRGQIVGVSRTASRARRYFFWEKGKMVDLGRAPGELSVQIQLNERGEALVSGSLWADGRLTRLPFAALALNDRGQVVGSRGREDPHAVLWDKGRLTDLGVLAGDKWSRADAINNDGIVVGTSYDGRTGMRAFRWSKGKLSELQSLSGFVDCTAVAINSSGQALGYCATRTPFRVHSVLWEDGRPRDLGTLGHDWVYPLQLNDRGQVVGKTQVRGEEHAFLWDGRKLRDLWPLSGYGVVVINERGQVAGATNGDAAIWDNGVITRLGRAGPRSASAAYSITTIGQVVGYSMTPNAPGPTYTTPKHAFLWTRN